MATRAEPIHGIDVDPDDLPESSEEGTELREVSESDSQGAPPAQVVVGGASMQDAANHINGATDSLLTILNGQPVLQGNANYGVIPQFKSVGYELPSDPFGDTPHYQPMSPEMLAQVNTPTFNDPILDATVVKEFKIADKAFSDASKNYEAAKRIKKDLPALRTARDTAQQHERNADAAATLAENAAKASGSGDDGWLAKRARSAAYDASVFTRELDNAVKKAESALNCFQDADGRVVVGRVIGTLVAGILTTGGALIWAFVFGGGRKVVGSGVLRFGIQPITRDFPDNLPTVDIDVLQENGDPVLVSAVHLHDDQKTQVDVYNGFTAKDLHITYQVPSPKVASASVDYILQATGAPGASTDPAKLTLNFTPVATDLVVVAPDRKATVSFTVPAGATLVGTPMELISWQLDSTTATYTPKGDTEGPTKELFYQVTNGTQAKLIALFPAVDPPAVDGMRSADTVIDLPAGSEPVKLLDAQNAQQTSVKVTGGAWTVAGNKITFTPINAELPTTKTSLDLRYVVVRGDKESTPGKVTINFPDVGPVPATQDLTRVTADRTKAFPFAVQGATLSKQAGDGAWNATATNVTFTPNTTLAATEVTVTAAYITPTEQGTLSLTYLPVPAPISQNNVARIRTQTILPTAVDVSKGNPIQAAYTVRLWDASQPAGSQAVDKVDDIDVNNVAAGAAEWTLSGKSIIFTPLAKPFKNSTAQVKYVLGAADGTYTAPAQLTLALSNDPVAYDATYEGVSGPTFDIDFLARCFIASPSQFSLIKVISIQPSTGVTATLVVGPALRVAIDGAVRGEVKVEYQVVDDLGRTSNTNVFTLIRPLRFLPMAADCLVSKAVLNGQEVGADVLTNSSTFFGTDPKSVRLTGLKDIGQGNQANQALLAKDGKSMRVPGEGTWVVGDDGKVGFTAEPHLSVPPTPVGFRFADVKGNLSNEAMVVIDPAMDPVTGLPASLTAMDDKTFWKNFQLHVSRAQPPLTDEQFLTTTSVLAGAVLAATLVPAKGAKVGLGVGRNPVAPADFEKALQAWIDNGQSWDDPVGTAQPTGLVATVAALVDPVTANSPLPMCGRYWRLELMAQMVASTLDDDPTNS